MNNLLKVSALFLAIGMVSCSPDNKTVETTTTVPADTAPMATDSAAMAPMATDTTKMAPMAPATTTTTEERKM